MASKMKKTEAELMESYRVALENAEKQVEIAQELTNIGYDSTVVAEGKTLLQETVRLYNANKTEDDETLEASATFKTTRAELEDLFKVHRKKAKVIFRNDVLTLKKLDIFNSQSQSYVKWLEEVKKFYTEAAADTDIQTKLARLAVSVEQITQGNNLVEAVETARSVYLREVGESQEATKVKDEAFIKMANWMTDFYAVAKIALEDKPQLLEALGILVRR